MDEAAANQLTVGGEIERIITNYKKDSPSRKDLRYYEDRLRKLEEQWAIFEDQDNKIRIEYPQEISHAYFTKEYYSQISAVYEKYREVFANNITRLQAALDTHEEDRLNPEHQKQPATGAIPKLPPKPVDEPSQKPNTDKIQASATSGKSSPIELPKGQNPVPDIAAGMIRVQSGAMESLQRILKKISQTPKPFSRSFCEVQRQIINDHWSKIANQHQGILEFARDPAQHGYDMERFYNLEELTYSTLIEIAEAVYDLPKETISSSTTATMKLPKVTLPKFEGDYLQWRQFHDLFTQMIHTQPMGASQKMWYLKTNLYGEAERLIRHLPVSDENYATAWKILVDRYENTRLLVTASLNKLLSQPKLLTESAAGLKALHDTTQECLLGLQNIGIDTNSWSPLMVHILLKKLDKTTHSLYEQSLARPREIQSLQNFLHFIEIRFQALESLGIKGRPNEMTKGDRAKLSSFMTTSREHHCILCKQNHQLFSCKSFLSKTPAQRYQTLKENNLCLNCMRSGHLAPKCTLRGCNKCSRKHNTLVHLGDLVPNAGKFQHPTHSNTPIVPRQVASKTNQEAVLPTNNQPNPATLSAQADRQATYVLLGTAVIYIIDSKGDAISCRAVFDSGSQLNFITEKLAKRLGFSPKVNSLCVEGIGKRKLRTQHRINITIKSRIGHYSTNLEAFILPQITSDQPACLLDTSSWKLPKNINLADPNFNQPGKIDLLIGAELFFQLMVIGQIKLGDNLPSLQNTFFGWIVAGKVNCTQQFNAVCGICTHDESKLSERVERFWRLEETEPRATSMTPAELECEAHFSRTMQQNEDGRFIVRLPFAQEPSMLGESMMLALTRFKSLERKLAKNPGLHQQYQEFMQEYLQLGHMKQANMDNVSKPYYFIPHHCVLKPESTTTKLRVVFDASSKTTTNLALNDILHTGPSIQEELFSILLRFRTPRFVFTGDITKMYRQVLVHEDDQKYQMIIWRDRPDLPIQYFQLCTVTYGVTTAPYLAIRCLHQLAAQSSQYPLGAHALKNSFYVDDVMTGADSLQEALAIQEQLKMILSPAGFELKKWCANHPALLQHIKPEDKAIQLDLQKEDDCHIKTLGITWLPQSDEFAIRTTWPEEEEKVTKRKVLSDIAHLFDPLGIMSPVVVSAKIFLQRLWELKLEWDAAVPMELHTQWIRFRQNLKELNDIKIPRHIFSHQTPQSTQLHAFADASEKAYGAAIYVRSTLPDGTTIVRLLCAKSRVAPLKATTLPRLELCAAKLAAELLHRVKRDLQWSQIPYFMWSDSEIVLAWLNSPSASFHTFVANRVSTIQELTPANNWRHVPSRDNPADLVSRGIHPEKLKTNTQWFYGPLFLYGPTNSWPAKSVATDIQLERKQPKAILSATIEPTHPINQINNKGSFNHLQRVMAYVLRFINNSRDRNSTTRKQSSLTVNELEDALIVIIREVQRQGFPEDLHSLNRTNYVHQRSSLNSLTPFLDSSGIIRVGGRLEASSLSYDAKHPMLLPYAHPITRLLMTHFHETNSHAGPQALLAIMRQRFWPVKGKTTARSIVQNCVRCARTKPQLLTQFMGNLPPRRVQPSRPFINTGVDFCGPFWIHFKLRGKRPQKCYVAIFCCFATKATHIEVVSDLTTEAFIGALKRFVSRRGNCRNIYCDNATNFVGARNQLQELKETIYGKHSEERIIKFSTTRGIDFHFIPPRAPHFGGLWEAAVKSAKHLMQRNIANASLTYEELETVMVEIEAILNSRPLTPMSSDPNDLSALTPGHFLIGEPLTAIVDPYATPVQTSLIQRWRLVSRLKHEFWERWTREYLNELQHRYKWHQPCKNVEPGTMVLIKDENLPVLKWPLGRVIQSIKGDDGFVRVADVRTSFGVLRRPIHKLAPLPINHESPDSGNQEASTVEDEPPDTSEGSAPPQPTPSTSHQEHPRTRSRPRDDTQDSNPGSSVPKRRRGLTLTSMLLLACFILPALANQVDIQPFTAQPGLYFEGMGPVDLFSNEWSVVIFYNMTTYRREFYALHEELKSLTYVCNLINTNQSCTQIVSQFRTTLAEIQGNDQLFSYQPRTRYKRAPLNIIGNIASSLFGVLDSEYAEHMAHVINNMENNDQHLLDLLKNQTSIVDSTINLIKNSQVLTDAKFSLVETHINKTIAEINAIKHELRQQRYTELFNSLCIHLILQCSEYQRIQSTLLDVIIDTHHGKINPQLLSPQQLQAQIGLIKENLPPTLRLPASQTNMLQVYQLMTVEGSIGPNQIIFRMKLPLFSYESFEMLRIIPVPVQINDTFLVIKPSTKYLIINLHRDMYYPVPDEELGLCSNIGQSSYMCKQHHPLYRKGSNISSCEIGYLTHAASPAGCKVSRVNQVPRWIQLLNPNQWIYTTKSESTINIACDNTVTQRTIKGSGLLKISNGCTIKEEQATLATHNLYTTVMRTSFLPSRNLTDILQSSEVSDLTYQPLPRATIDADIRSLKGNLSRLQAAEELTNRTTSHDIHHFGLGYTSLLLVIIIIAYLAYRFVTTGNQRRSPRPPIPLPRRLSTAFTLDPNLEVELQAQRGEDV